MKAEFTITVDVPHNLVRIAMGGFFSNDDIGRFVDARAQAYRSLQCGPNEHVALVDIRKMDIQAQESVAAFQRVLSEPSQASRRLAVVVAHSLARMQMVRAADSRNPTYFLTVEEAEAWLAEA